jgi:zinc/manganese transport system permease protein
MFHYAFMYHAFLAGTIIAIMSGVIGVYVIARSSSFLAHTFSHIGFSGSAFAVYMGFSPLNGFLLFTVASSIVIGQMGVKVFRRDVSISVVLSIFLGLGLLFLSLSSKQANSMSALLFGNILGISLDAVWQISYLSAGVLVVLAIGYKMLTFDSFDPIGAQAAGLPFQFISVGFLVVLAIATAEASQVVGALMVFTLMTIPAAAARNFTHSLGRMILYSTLIALIGMWLGLTLGYYTNLPISFLISGIEGAFYFLSLGWGFVLARTKPTETVSRVQAQTFVNKAS